MNRRIRMNLPRLLERGEASQIQQSLSQVQKRRKSDLTMIRMNSESMKLTVPLKNKRVRRLKRKQKGRFASRP
jgi:hypothetical protein